MKTKLSLFLMLVVIGFAACNDKEDLSNEKWNVESINDDSTYVMEHCIGTLSYDSEYGCYVFYPDMYYGDPFHGGQELSNQLLLKNIPDTLKAYTDSTLVISGSYTPLYTKTQRNTNCPLIVNVFEGEIKWAAPYKIIYDYGCDTEGAVPQSWIFDKSVSKNIDKTWYLINIFVHIVAPMRGHNIDKDVASNDIISNLNKSYAGHGISVKMENTL